MAQRLKRLYNGQFLDFFLYTIIAKLYLWEQASQTSFTLQRISFSLGMKQFPNQFRDQCEWQFSMNYCCNAETKRVKTTLNTQVHSRKQHLRDKFITRQGSAKTDSIRLVLKALPLAFCERRLENMERIQRKITKSTQNLDKSFADSDFTNKSFHFWKRPSGNLPAVNRHDHRLCAPSLTLQLRLSDIQINRHLDKCLCKAHGLWNANPQYRVNDFLYLSM